MQVAEAGRSPRRVGVSDHVGRGRGTHLTVFIALAAGLVGTEDTTEAQTADLSGAYHQVWLDPIRGGGGTLLHFITTADGHSYRIELDPALARVAGPALVGAQVRVSGDHVAPPSVPSRVRAHSLQVLQAPPHGAEGNFKHPGQAAAAPRSVPYLTVLCKFADSVTVEPRSASAYTQLLTANSYPGPVHLFSEITDGYVDLSGSRVLGWYTLPRPKAAYFATNPDGTPDLSGNGTKFDDLQRDCLDAADPDVDFNAFFGVNLQFNGWWASSNGGWWWVTRDGVTRALPMTWMASWVNPATYAHEIGHSLGLPHSSTPYEQQYGSVWDFMSSGMAFDQSISNWAPVGTIAFQQQLLGTPAALSLSPPAPGTRDTIDLARTNGAGGPQSMTLTLPDGTYYTIAARRKQGSYDKWLPMEGVIVHHVDPASPVAVPARVVDVDDNGNPNDAGAAWTVGETFADSVHGLGFRVLAATTDGYRISVRNGWQLALGVSGPGRITGPVTCTAAKTPCEILSATRGSSHTLTAVPDSGAVFVEWTGACTGAQPICTVALNTDLAAHALFTLPVRVLTVSLKNGIVGVTYLDTLKASGGDSTLQWSIVAGALPPGMGLNSATGVIGGSPEVAGTFPLTVQAATTSQDTTRVITLSVAPPSITLTRVVSHLTGAAPLSRTLVKYFDRLGNLNGRLDIGDVAAWRDQISATAADRTHPQIARTEEPHASSP